MSENETKEPQFGVGAQRVAQVYAEALLNASAKQGQAEAVLEQLASLIQDLFPADPQLELFFSSGAIGRERKAELILRGFEKRAEPLFLNFLLVLNAHERLDLLRPILRAAREMADERARRIPVLVRSAVPLPDEQRERLLAQLRQRLELEPVLEARVEPDLLGGLVVRVGDRVYDASVRTQLENIRNQLIARSSYEIQSGRDRFSSPDGN